MNSPKIYGLIGKSLSHSFSKQYFEKKFEKLQLNAVYDNYELRDIGMFDELVKNQPNGLNVTIPYKEQIIPFLDDLSREAEEIRAVNTIQFINGRKIGHNTDAFGFHQLIKPFFKSRHERAVILGTGGASKAVEYVLTKLGCDVIFLSRNPTKPDEFAYEEAGELMFRSHKLIVNTTPLGTYPNIHEIPPIPTQFFNTDHLVVDLIYNPEKTQLLKEASLKGATVLNGLTMLEQQAEKAWQIWNE